MAVTLEDALSRFLAKCAYVSAVHDLTTKWRIDLKDGYFLDIFFQRNKREVFLRAFTRRTAYIGLG